MNFESTSSFVMNSDSSIDFKTNKESLTIGVESEYQVLDATTLNLTPRANDILSMTTLTNLSNELFQSTIEFITPVCSSVREIEEYYTSAMPILHSEGKSLGLTFCGTGTHPRAGYWDRLITPTLRYQSLVAENKWLIRRMAVYGLHVHLGMKSGDDCIKFHNFFLHFIPHLIALSASSPFWHGMNTELVSCRPTMFEALPTAGIPYPIKDWRDFEDLIKRLQLTKSIKSFKDLWWDIRPSPSHGTIEIRICDGAATTSEMLSIVAFIHTLGIWFEENQEEWLQSKPLNQWIFRENKWRAIRIGLHADVVISNDGDTRSIRDDLARWMELLSPYYKKLNYQIYRTGLEQILSKGNSSDRQKKLFEQTQSIEDVVELNVKEFCKGHPG
jgi:carboxylate-amine ligase